MELRHRAVILIALCMAACALNEPTEPPATDEKETTPPQGAIIYTDDSTEWRVWIPFGSVYVYDEYHVDSPYHIPTHEEAKILKTITYGASGQRYLTDDGYTFGMPSASITKAGQKTKYSVLALWRRRYIINQGF